MAEAFDSAVTTLRSSFISKDESSTVFKPEYHKRIPADGFSMYAKGIWEAIENNKDLDLPSQQELLAQFRCDEIAGSAMAIFDGKIEPIERTNQPGVVQAHLGADMAAALSEALEAFDSEASRYHNGVYTKKRSDLLSSIEARLLTLFKSQLASMRKSCLQKYESNVLHEIRQDKSYDFRQVTASHYAEVTEDFKEEAKACAVQPMSWHHDEDLKLLQTELEEITSRLRIEETKRINDRLYRAMKVTFEEIVASEFNRLDATLWDRILDQCIDTSLGQTSTTLSERLMSLDLPDAERQRSIEDLKRRAWRLLRTRVGEETTESHLLLKLREHFEDSFKFDKEGVPVVWKAGDDIESKYRSAREETLSIIPVFSQIRRADGTSPKLPESNDEDFNEDTILRVLSVARQSDISSRLKKIADAVYIDAKRSTVSSVATVPLYFYGLLLVLGWNELMALLRNPLYFVTIIFLFLVVYSVYTLNLSGPVEQVARAMFGTVFDIVKDKLRSALEVSQESVPELMHATGASVSAAGRRSTRVSAEDVAMDILDGDGKKDN